MTHWNPIDHMNECAARKPASGGKNYPRAKRRLEATDSHDAWARRNAAAWYSAKRQILSDYSAACLNPITDQPSTWEF